MKVMAIEEANDITTMKLDELFGLLCTFELSFEDQEQKKKNGTAFQSICEDNSKQSLKAPKNENLTQEVALLLRRFTKFKNKFYKKAEGYGS
ncbi:gag-pol polyprotein [Cucumis melo var. makuwa]|uniref:Gag-pol polyprotein n=1 Tax=Cucumis melo var. makuwa TaxID=1194695 RepID=A0A5D3D5S3_CUCMM|nr:gag-pol polyprotein [Cucumis melo var. makuwa]